MLSLIENLDTHLQQIATTLLHLWVELLIPWTEERICDVQPLAIQPASQTASLCLSLSMVINYSWYAGKGDWIVVSDKIGDP